MLLHASAFKAMRRTGRHFVAGTVAVNLLCASLVSAAPYRPADDSLVLLTVSPTTAAVEAELRSRHKKLAAKRDDLATALEVARLAIRDGRARADPRRYGQAQAALGPWWSDAGAPLEARLLRAVIRQALHEFAGAKADLDAILESDPGHAQARLTRAFVHQATGVLAEAEEDCRTLPASIGRLAAAVCLARVEALTGAGTIALAHLARMVSIDRGADPEVRRWARGTAAEIAVSLGRGDEAEQWFRLATETGGDIPTLVAYADYLLESGRPADVLSLLADRDASDVVLLRLAIAATAIDDPRGSAWSELLGERFKAGGSSGLQPHLREEGRFSLEVLGDAARALELARRNWIVQKEPADARLVLAAALAAKDPEAAADVVAFIETTRLDDVHLKPLVDQVREARR